MAKISIWAFGLNSGLSAFSLSPLNHYNHYNHRSWRFGYNNSKHKQTSPFLQSLLAVMISFPVSSLRTTIASHPPSPGSFACEWPAATDSPVYTPPSPVLTQSSTPPTANNSSPQVILPSFSSSFGWSLVDEALPLLITGHGVELPSIKDIYREIRMVELARGRKPLPRFRDMKEQDRIPETYRKCFSPSYNPTVSETIVVMAAHIFLDQFVSQKDIDMLTSAELHVVLRMLGKEMGLVTTAFDESRLKDVEYFLRMGIMDWSK
ncbi:hypothetical protein BXZ70DRAFT_438153 [Cristinia sonorae]|uniref:Uncharacterized protein n=1 Tax=Cristinia sonorae TaxID=1940300 RepID=A0A8K0UIY9_9AGAR|nr:hypothetical protein BXZ70DRAFT_438153 [Cristinia sonorae]